MDLILRSKRFSIPNFFKNMSQTREDIFQSLTETKEYTIKSYVSEEILQSFIKFWVNEEQPNIDSSNYAEYCQLGDEFQIKYINDFLQSQHINSDNYETTLLKVINPSIALETRQMLERDISRNLDTYLLRYRNKLIGLPIQTLYRIFSDPGIKFSQHEIAYQGIVDHFKEHNDISIFTLLSFLDGSQLNQDSLQECIKEQDSRCGFCPKMNYSSIEEKVTRKDAQIAQLEQIVSSQQELIDNITTKLNDQIQKNESTKSELHQTITLLKGQISQNDEKIKKLFLIQTDPKNVEKSKIGCKSFCS